MSDLEDIFKTESEVEETTEESTESTEVEEEVEKPTELEGENQESDETPASTEETPKKEESEESWTKKAVLDERQKRQKLEKRIRELEAKLNQPQVEKEEENIPDPIDDPAGYANYVKNSLKQEMFAERVRETKEEMQAKHDDYPEMELKFIELSNDNPALAQKLRQSSNPAKFAYDTAKNYFESQKFSDPSNLAKLREEIKKEILADLVKNQNSNLKPKSNIDLPDLSNRTSAGSNVTQKEQYRGTVDEYF